MSAPPTQESPADTLAAEVDSLAAQADSALADTSAALVDTSGALSRLGQDIERVTEAAREGRFDEILDLVMAALVDFALNGLVPALFTFLLYYLVYRIGARVLT
ncbi:MAG: hypothetical protein R3362_11505, partial [Rhodothermales bacterium]|nr:hypothetical protein [Rhodothermales bacterium]